VEAIVNIQQYLVHPDSRIDLKSYPTNSTGEFKDKKSAEEKLADDINTLAELQDLLHADSRCALLVILQGIDTSGKDGTIKHVMSGLNPQGVQVTTFGAPSAEELHHDYMWRCVRALPAKGRIGIFNRSYYEEVLVVRVHPELLAAENLHPDAKTEHIWADRYQDINNFEAYLARNGILVIKFFLHISHQEQKARLLERIDNPAKNWKFSAADLREREYWDDYMRAYRHMLEATSTEVAPWYIVPADHKWMAHIVVADAIVSRLKPLNLSYPVVGPEQVAILQKAKQTLEGSK
jgi:PPK2 family polyphosphate:nucleotide phosphotransferase